LSSVWLPLTIAVITGTQQDAEQEPDTNLPDPFTVTAPTSLVLTATAEETGFGSVVLNILVAWTDTAEAFIEKYVIEAKRSALTDYDVIGEVEQGVGQFNIAGINLTSTDNQWDVRVHAVNTLGAVSGFLSGTVTSIEFRRFVNTTSDRQADDRRLGFPADTPADALAIFVFEDGTATTVLNEVVNTDDATITTGAGSAWIEGPAGGAYDLNETAHMKATHATAFDIGLTTAFTVDVILRWDANAAATQDIVRHDQDYLLKMTTVGLLQYATRDNWVTQTPLVDLSSTGLNLQGKWIHIHWEYDGADVSTFYINGVLQSTHNGSGAASVAAISDDLHIASNGATSRFNGAIAYVRVVKGARSTFPFLSDIIAGLKTRTILMHANKFMPATDTTLWVNTVSLDPNATGSFPAYRAALENLPVGTVITEVEARFFRQTTSDVSTLKLVRVSDTAGTTTITTLTHSSTSWQTITNAITETVAPDQSYQLLVDLNSVTAAKDSRFLWAKVTYEIP